MRIGYRINGYTARIYERDYSYWSRPHNTDQTGTSPDGNDVTELLNIRRNCTKDKRNQVKKDNYRTIVTKWEKQAEGRIFENIAEDIRRSE